MRWQQPAARPARPGPTAGAGVGGGAGGGEGGCPLLPAAAARNLQEAAGPGQGSEGAPQDAGDPGPAGSWGPSGGSAGKAGEGEGKEGRRPLPGPRGHPRAQSRGWRREQRRCRVSPPQGATWRLRAGPERPLEPRRWRDFALRSERAPSRSLSAGNVSERLPGTAQYGARSFATAPEGGEPASTARRSGGGGGGVRGSASSPSPPPARCAPAPPRQPPAHPLGSRAFFQPPSPLCAQVLLPPPHPQPLQRAGWSLLLRPGSWGRSLGRALLVSSAQNARVPAGKEPRSITLHSFTSRLE